MQLKPVTGQYAELIKSSLDLNGFRLEIRLKKIKHIYFRVYPASQKVVISAPGQISAGELGRVIRSRQAWIEQQTRKAIPRKAEGNILKMPNGEEGIRFKGVVYPLERRFCPGEKKRVELVSGRMILKLVDRAKKDSGADVISGFLRQALKREMMELIKKWEPVLGVTVAECRVRKMKTRWGSCNITARRIWLNLALIHFSPSLIEYVVVHEMVHLLERKHNHRFEKLMDRFIPDWRDLKKRLNSGCFNESGDKCHK